MARAKASGTAPCVHCGGTSLRKNGHKSGHQRWSCPDCGKSFTETYGTPMYRLRHDPAEVARTLLIVMRRGGEVEQSMVLQDALSISTVPGEMEILGELRLRLQQLRVREVVDRLGVRPQIEETTTYLNRILHQ